ncbi:hypothetical protein BD770DRAFT_449072 [Pilaira anomala]|nr:hypothetical protein BD770DRAFT_449072 [Pilaira anomala]
MKTLLTLPSDILLRIVKKLSRKDLAQCLLVSQLFYDYTFEEFYKSMCLNQWHLKALESYMLSTNSAEHSPTFQKSCQLVKRLAFNMKDWPEKESDFHLLFVTAPKIFQVLTVIDISVGCPKINFLTNLWHSINATELPHLQHLKVFERNGLYKIPFTSIMDRIAYLNVCFKFRGSLTHLEMLDPHRSYTLLYHQHNKTHLNLLPFFDKLENLTIYYYPEDKRVGRLIGPVVLSACPKLTHFEIMCDNSNMGGKKVNYNIILAKEIKINNENCPETTQTIQNLQLKNVQLQIKKMNTVCMKNILLNIPVSRLDKFVLEFVCGEDANKWMKLTPVQELKNFLRYLQTAKETVLYARYAGKLSSSVSLLKTELSSVRKLWAISNTLTDDLDEIKSRIRVEVEFRKTSGTNDNSFFNLDIRRKCLVLSQELNEIDFFKGYYPHQQLVPFYDTVLPESFYDMKVIISNNSLFDKILYLMKNYSHVKQLKVSMETDPKRYCFILNRKPMIPIPIDLQKKDVHPISNHYSPTEVYTACWMLPLIKKNHRLIDFPINVDSFTFMGLPIDRNSYGYTFKKNYYFRQLTLDFSFYKLHRGPLPLQITVMDRNKKVIGDLIYLTESSTNSIIFTPGLIDTKDKRTRKSHYIFWSAECDLLTVSNGGSVIHSFRCDTNKSKNFPV